MRFREAVKQLVAPHAEALGLPMPDVEYNCEALFYVDNDRADTHGLMQGLADALQDARVITNDRLLRTWNGTDQFLDPRRPRVEVHLLPYAAHPSPPR